MISEIQYLRAVAALMVVFYHAFPQLERMGYHGDHFEVLSTGVDIFFVISGFIMTYISIQRPMGAVEFMRNRIVRIVPLYWALTLVVALVGILMPSALQSSEFVFSHFLASIFFVPAVHPVSGHLFPLLTPGWTLNYEMYFYFVFSLFLLIGPTWRYLFVSLAITALTIGFSLSRLGVVSEFYGNPIVIEFCAGIVLGWVYCNRRGLFRWPGGQYAGPAIVLTGLATMMVLNTSFGGGPRLIWIALPSMVIVAGGLVATESTKRWRIGWLGRVGDASYSLYLSHFITMSLVGQVARKVVFRDESAPIWSYPIFMISAAILCVLVSLPIHDLLEVRIQKRFESHFNRRRGIA